MNPWIDNVKWFITLSLSLIKRRLGVALLSIGNLI